MKYMILMLLITMLIKSIILITNLNKKIINFMNNLECGFNNMNNMKINYSMNFIYIMIIFVMFDIELMILIPLIMNNKKYYKLNKMINMFILFMMYSSLMELLNNKMMWMI